jgi:hypothetical protein
MPGALFVLFCRRIRIRFCVRFAAKGRLQLSLVSIFLEMSLQTVAIDRESKHKTLSAQIIHEIVCSIVHGITHV